jgi:hypothetical protein
MPAPFANRLPPRRPDPVTLVWIGGIALAALAYAVGPEHFVARVLAAVSHVGWVLEDIARGLTQTAMDAMRAAAIGCYGVFVALSFISIGRGGRGRLGLVVISVVFALLVWGAWGDAPAINTRWLAALLLSAIAALSATRRITR